jgi:hypothetical protein
MFLERKELYVGRVEALSFICQWPVRYMAELCLGSVSEISFGYSSQPLQKRDFGIATNNVVVVC